MDANLKLPKMDGVCKDRKLQTEFRSKIGSMLQFARFTRPDILYPVIYLSTFQSHPAKIHMDAADELMRYLKHTMSHKMTHDCSVDIKTAVAYAVGCSDEKSDPQNAPAACKRNDGCCYSSGTYAVTVLALIVRLI